MRIDTEGYRERLKFAVCGDKSGLEKSTSGRSRKIEKTVEKH